MALEPGEFFQSDLIGCEVVEPDRAVAGRGDRMAGGGGPGLLEVGERLVDSVRAVDLRGDRSGRDGGSRSNCRKV